MTTQPNPVEWTKLRSIRFNKPVNKVNNANIDHLGEVDVYEPFVTKAADPYTMQAWYSHKMGKWYWHFLDRHMKGYSIEHGANLNDFSNYFPTPWGDVPRWRFYLKEVVIAALAAGGLAFYLKRKGK